MTAQPWLAFDVVVAGVERLSRSFVRVTFVGDSLDEFHRCGDLGPRDLRVKLLLAADGSGPAPVPDFSGRHWQTRWRALDESVRGVMRTYTVRAFDGERLVVDFVLHGEGPASTWASQAVPGDPMVVIGPNRSSEWYGGIEWRPPPPPSRLLLVGDETALPAIGSILATLPSPYAGDVVVEVESEQDFLPLVTQAALELRYVARAGRPRGELLMRELRRVTTARPGTAPEDVDVDHDLLWEVPARSVPSPCYAWVAGEASVVRDIRRYLVSHCAVDRRSVAFMGYWREGRPEPS